MPTDISVELFLNAFKTLSTPLVFVINCDASMFEDNQLSFLKTFINELYNATLAADQLRIFLFVNFEDNTQSATLEQQLKQLQQQPNQDKYLAVLPRLKSINSQLIKTWLITYITPNAGRVEELMATYFNNLSMPLSMYEADKKMHAFITAVNSSNTAIV